MSRGRLSLFSSWRPRRNLFGRILRSQFDKGLLTVNKSPDAYEQEAANTAKILTGLIGK